MSNTANFSDEIHTKILQSFRWQIVGRSKTPPPWRFGSKPNREQKPERRRLFKTEDFSQDESAPGLANRAVSVYVGNPTVPEALTAWVWEGLVNGSHTANAPLPKDKAPGKSLSEVKQARWKP